MSHHLINTNYTGLIERLNRFPQSAPSSPLLYKILEILFSEKEAGLVSLIPVKPFTAEKASAIWKLDITSSRKILDELSARAIPIDFNQNGSRFFEFSMMRI